MVDEEQYRRTYSGVIDQPCPFEKAILTRNCQCSRATRTNIAEREAVNCSDRHARRLCGELLAMIRDKANFALGLTRTPGSLPHVKSMKIQCGGLLGLQRKIAKSAEVTDVFALVRMACAKYGALSKFPFDDMIRAVADFKGRQRRKRHGHV